MGNKELPSLAEEVVSDILADLRLIRRTAEDDSNKDQLLTRAERLVQAGTDDLFAILNEKEAVPHSEESNLTQLIDIHNILFKNGLKADIFSFHDGDLSYKNLPDSQLLIFSPLSSDYFAASFIQRCTQNFYSSSFNLKPIILSERVPDHFPRILAVPDVSNPAFLVIEQTGVFVDFSSSGRTMAATRKVAREFQRNLMALRKAA